MKRTTAVLVVTGLVLILAVSSFAVAAGQGRGGNSAGTDSVSADATRMVKIVYYDTGGTPHNIELNTTQPGTLYHVPPYSDVIVKATGYFKGPGGMGEVEIWDEDDWDYFVTKFIPSEKTVTATMPYALYLTPGEHYNLGACVTGPGWAGEKDYYFQIECP